MPNVDSVLSDLKKKGSDKRRDLYARHGAPADRMYGVSVADLKAIAKKIKGDHALACALYDTGNLDAMYLAGLVADGSQMTAKQLDAWAKSATAWSMISEYTVPWVAVESAHARELATKWIKSNSEPIAAAGWSTYAGIVATTPDDALRLDEIDALLATVARDIHQAPNRVRYTMNAFVIAVGAHVTPLSKRAQAVAKAVGTLSVDMGGTACQVPDATEYIQKIETMGRIGQKRKAMRC